MYRSAEQPGAAIRGALAPFSGYGLRAVANHEVPLESNAGGRAQGFELLRQPLAHSGQLCGLQIGQEIAERAALAPGEQVVGAAHIVDEGVRCDVNILEAGFLQQAFELGGVDAIVHAGGVCRVGLRQAYFDHGFSYQLGRLVLSICVGAVHSEAAARFENPPCLTQRLGLVGDPVKDAVRVSGVETRVGERGEIPRRGRHWL